MPWVRGWCIAACALPNNGLEKVKKSQKVTIPKKSNGL
jgi:hypothetical protein